MDTQYPRRNRVETDYLEQSFLPVLNDNYATIRVRQSQDTTKKLFFTQAMMKRQTKPAIS